MFFNGAIVSRGHTVHKAPGAYSARGMSESLAARLELLHVPHWSYLEMRDAFGFDIEQHLYFGGYPGAATLIGEPERWRRYVADSLIETSVSRDLLMLTRVDKPALLRGLFDLACRYSGQILSYTKMLGQLQDAGNTTTPAHQANAAAAGQCALFYWRKRGVLCCPLQSALHAACWVATGCRGPRSQISNATCNLATTWYRYRCLSWLRPC